MAHNSKQLARDFRQSGLTQKQFCRDKSVPLSTLRYHIRKQQKAEGVSLNQTGFRSGTTGGHFLSLPFPVKNSSNTFIIYGAFSPDDIAKILSLYGER